MKKTLIAEFSRFLLTIIVSLCICGAASAADDKKALGQLEGAAGQSINTVQVPPVPPPTPVTPSTGTAGGYDVGSSTGTAGGTSTPTVKPTTQGAPIIKPPPKH